MITSELELELELELEDMKEIERGRAAGGREGKVGRRVRSGRCWE